MMKKRDRHGGGKGTCEKIGPVGRPVMSSKFYKCGDEQEGCSGCRKHKDVSPEEILILEGIVS